VNGSRKRSCCQRHSVSRAASENWRGHDDVMQIRSLRGSGKPVWVNALLSAPFRLGPDPRTALGPAASRAASTGRTRDRTRPMLQQRQKVLAKAPSTRDPKRTFCVPILLCCTTQPLSVSGVVGCFRRPVGATHAATKLQRTATGKKKATSLAALVIRAMRRIPRLVCERRGS
jgi:hypothetical protein